MSKGKIDFYERNEKIQKEHIKGASVADLSKKYGLSRSRVYQILGRILLHCAVHMKPYYSKCMSCYYNNDYKQYKSAEDTAFFKEVKRVWSNDESSDEKTRTVKILRDKYDFSYPTIAKIIGRTHPTVIYHYKK